MISLHFILTALVVVIAPGTGVIYTLSVALGQGQRAAILAAIGCTFGILPHLLAASLGLAALLHTSAVLFQLVKFAGVAYLLFLAWQALRSGGALTVAQDHNRQAGFTIARRAALINILNPKLSIFFLALLPPFLSGVPDTARFEMILMGAVFMGLTFVVFVVYGSFAVLARSHILTRPAVMRWLNRGFAAVFAGLGLRLALDRA